MATRPHCGLSTPSGSTGALAHTQRKGKTVKSLKLGAVLLSGALFLTACGGDDDDGGRLPKADWACPQVRLAIDGDDYMNQLAWMVADENYWPDLGFTEDRPRSSPPTSTSPASSAGTSGWPRARAT